MFTTTTPLCSQSDDINIRTTMVVYYQGAGPRVIGNTIPFLGVPAGQTFRNIFYKSTNSFTTKIMKELQISIDKGLEEEITCTIKHELASEYTDAEITQFVLNFKSNCWFIPDSIRMLPIVASYDMG